MAEWCGCFFRQSLRLDVAMTLIANEFRCARGDIRESFIVSVADRLVVFGNRSEFLPKVLPVERLRATLSFYGLADVSGGTRTMYDFLLTFVRQSKARTLEAFAADCKQQLEVLNPDLAMRASGLHLAGFNDWDIPELWFTRNINHHDTAGGTTAFNDIT
jgi:hypothetical protein